MNLLFNLGHKLLNNWINSSSQRFCNSLRSILLSSYINNILGSITALSFMILLCFGALSFSDYSILPELLAPLVTTALFSLFSSISLSIYLTRAKKIEEIIGLDSLSSLNSKQFDLGYEIIPVAKAYLDEILRKDSKKVDKMEEVLISLTEVMRELEVKITHLEHNGISREMNREVTDKKYQEDIH